MRSEMSDDRRRNSNIPPEQEAIRAKCFHPTGMFVEFPREEIEQSIPNRFEKIMLQFPERVAIKTPKVSLTYSEINKAANRIAGLILNELGRQAEPVAIFSEELDEVVVAILGVLKAGKFYVPLDPSFPDARIHALLDDCHARLILGREPNSGFRSRTRKLISVEGCQFFSSTNPSLVIAPENFACILYTSGSTGEPKGVIQDHRNVLHKVRTYTNEVHISPADRLSFFYSPAFAAAVHNLFGALLNGACVVLFDLRCEDIAGLGEYLIKEKITMYDSVSTLFRHFASTLKGDEEFPHLRLIRLGSEQIYQSDVELFKKLFSESCILANSMGITEAFLVRLLLLDKK